MRSVAEALFTSEGTRARTAKVAALARALVDVWTREPTRLPLVARFLTGTMLPTEDERTLGAGGRLVFEAAMVLTGMAAEDLSARARRSKFAENPRLAPMRAAQRSTASPAVPSAAASSSAYLSEKKSVNTSER